MTSASTNRWLVLLLVCVAQFMVILDATIVNVALPSIERGLHFSPTGLQWVVNAYTLVFGGFLLLGGRAAEQVVLSTMTAGAANDIERAVEIARKMVREFGMSPLGPIYLIESRTDAQSQTLLDKAEDAITNIVNSQLERAR